MEPVRIGVIGCGKISNTYLTAAPDYPVLNIVACADIDNAAAQRLSTEFDLQAMDVDALLKRDDIETILNLTVPNAHAPLNLAALRAGKHVYCEKPFAIDSTSGSAVLDTAQKLGLRVGSAPDTFLGSGHQMVRSLLDMKRIGRVVAASATWMSHGHEGWHPSPQFFYEPGGGPHFDMGPYYLTAMVHALGPVQAVTAMAGRGYEARTVGSGPNAGKTVPVQINTHVSGSLKFVNDCIATITMSYDVWRHAHPRLEFYGTTGSISSPNPNSFTGPVAVANQGEEWTEIPLSTGAKEHARSVGLADLCLGLRTGAPHRCSGELAQHVLEIMVALDHSAKQSTEIAINSRPARPALLTAASNGVYCGPYNVQRSP